MEPVSVLLLRSNCLSFVKEKSSGGNDPTINKEDSFGMNNEQTIGKEK